YSCYDMVSMSIFSLAGAPLQPLSSLHDALPILVVASVISALRPAPSEGQGKRIKLAYCSQLLCGVPYEVARSAGLYKSHGLYVRSEEHTSELQSRGHLVCRLLLEKKIHPPDVSN